MTTTTYTRTIPNNPRPLNQRAADVVAYEILANEGKGKMTHSQPVWDAEIFRYIITFTIESDGKDH